MKALTEFFSRGLPEQCHCVIEENDNAEETLRNYFSEHQQGTVEIATIAECYMLISKNISENELLPVDNLKFDVFSLEDYLGGISMTAKYDADFKSLVSIVENDIKKVNGLEIEENANIEDVLKDYFDNNRFEMTVATIADNDFRIKILDFNENASTSTEDLKFAVFCPEIMSHYGGCNRAEIEGDFNKLVSYLEKQIENSKEFQSKGDIEM